MTETVLVRLIDAERWLTVSPDLSADSIRKLGDEEWLPVGVNHWCRVGAIAEIRVDTRPIDGGPDSAQP